MGFYRVFHLLHVSWSFHFVQVTVFGVSFLQIGRWQFCLILESAPLWIGLRQCLVNVSWLGGLVPIFWWIKLDFISLKDSAMSSSVFCSVYELGMASGSLSASVQSCAPILLRIGMGHLTMKLSSLWVWFGPSVDTESFGRTLTY